MALMALPGRGLCDIMPLWNLSEVLAVFEDILCVLKLVKDRLQPLD